MNNAEYGFNGNSDRIAEDTDYAKARQYNSDLQIYWTCSIKNGTYVLVVNGAGSLNYGKWSDMILGVRPYIKLSIAK